MKCSTQLGEAANAEPPAAARIRLGKAAGVPMPQWVLDAADNLEKEGLFEAPPGRAIPTASGCRFGIRHGDIRVRSAAAWLRGER